MSTIHAYTESGCTYPAYVNLGEFDPGVFSLTVRSQGDGGHNVGIIHLTREQLLNLVNDASVHLDGDYEQVDKNQAIAASRDYEAEGKTAPRVTPADITANIHHVETVKHVTQSGQVLRWAVLVTQSGFAAVGKPSVAVSSENDDAEIGEQVAFDNSRQELWPLMGYALKQQLHDTANAGPAKAQPAPGAAHAGYSTMPPHQQRVVDELAELDGKRVKLQAFFGTPIYAGLHEDEQWRLARQHDVMEAYGGILRERIAAFTL